MQAFAAEEPSRRKHSCSAHTDVVWRQIPAAPEHPVTPVLINRKGRDIGSGRKFQPTVATRHFETVTYALVQVEAHSITRIQVRVRRESYIYVRISSRTDMRISIHLELVTVCPEAVRPAKPSNHRTDRGRTSQLQ